MGHRLDFMLFMYQRRESEDPKIKATQHTVVILTQPWILCDICSCSPLTPIPNVSKKKQKKTFSPQRPNIGYKISLASSGGLGMFEMEGRKR